MESFDPRSAAPKIAEALALLQAAEKGAASGQPPALAEAIRNFDQAIARLTSIPGLKGDPRRWLALAWIGRGNVLRMLGPKAQAEALKSYDQAIEALNAPVPEADEVRRNDLANAWTNRGIALMSAGTADKLAEALRSFDEAIEVRRSLPAGPHHEFHYALAASWMNRADALTRLGGVENLAAGMVAYDEAIALMRSLPFAVEDAFRHRLAAASMNRSITRQAQGGPDAFREAIAGFDECIELLRGQTLLAHPEGAQLLACAWLNRAGAAFAAESGLGADDVQSSAREAMVLTKPFEEQVPALADIGLKARHALCRVLSTVLEQSDAKNELPRELLGDATDLVDEALALARLWDERGLNAFRPIAMEFFRYGMLLYQRYQPQFLGDFVLENLDPATAGGILVENPEAIRTAGDTIWRTLQELQRRSFASVGKPEMDRVLQTLIDLRAADEKLREVLTRR